MCGSGDGKELEKCRESIFSFFSVPIECVFILTPCNINAISALIVMNNIRKELVMIAAHFGDKIRAQNQTRSVILILTVNKNQSN